MMGTRHATSSTARLHLPLRRTLAAAMAAAMTLVLLPTVVVADDAPDPDAPTPHRGVVAATLAFEDQPVRSVIDDRVAAVATDLVSDSPDELTVSLTLEHGERFDDLIDAAEQALHEALVDALEAELGRQLDDARSSLIDDATDQVGSWWDGLDPLLLWALEAVGVSPASFSEPIVEGLEDLDLGSLVARADVNDALTARADATMDAVDLEAQLAEQLSGFLTGTQLTLAHEALTGTAGDLELDGDTRPALGPADSTATASDGDAAAWPLLLEASSAGVSIQDATAIRLNRLTAGISADALAGFTFTPTASYDRDLDGYIELSLGLALDRTAMDAAVAALLSDGDLDGAGPLVDLVVDAEDEADIATTFDVEATDVTAEEALAIELPVPQEATTGPFAIVDTAAACADGACDALLVGDGASDAAVRVVASGSLKGTGEAGELQLSWLGLGDGPDPTHAVDDAWYELPCGEIDGEPVTYQGMPGTILFDAVGAFAGEVSVTVQIPRAMVQEQRNDGRSQYDVCYRGDHGFQGRDAYFLGPDDDPDQVEGVAPLAPQVPGDPLVAGPGILADCDVTDTAPCIESRTAVREAGQLDPAYRGGVELVLRLPARDPMFR